MPFYQLVCIAAHYKDYRNIKGLVTEVATHVLKNGGVVRKLDYWGTSTLPQRMRKAKQYYNIGDYWTMQFDASPTTLQSLNGLVRRDPRVIRCTSLKIGEKLTDVQRLPEVSTTRP